MTSYQWGLCALRLGIQNSMEAILACHPALSTKWLDWVANSCERWRIRTDPIATKNTREAQLQTKEQEKWERSTEFDSLERWWESRQDKAQHFIWAKPHSVQNHVFVRCHGSRPHNFHENVNLAYILYDTPRGVERLISSFCCFPAALLGCSTRYLYASCFMVQWLAIYMKT